MAGNEGDSNITREKFFQKTIRVLRLKDGDEGLGLIYDAYRLAKDTHREQMRDNGERFFEHPRRVACILLEFGWGSVKEIILALIHDCWEDGYIRLAQFENQFGKEIAAAVRILSKDEAVFEGDKLVKVPKDLDVYWQAILEAPAWIRRVKLADRLDNLRTMDVWCTKRVKKYLRETRDYVLPIADRTNSVLSRKIREEFDRISSELEKNGHCLG